METAMFNVRPELGSHVSPYTELPGFRVGLSEDLPGFNIDQNGLVRQGLPIKEPIVPAADVPSAANDNPVCNRAYGRCTAAARMARLPWEAYTEFLQRCRTVYELCLHREDDPRRIGRNGDFYELPDGSRLIFRQGYLPQYIPSPAAPPVRPAIPPNYEDPNRF